MTPRDEYERRRDRWRAVVVDGERRHLLLSNARLALFALAGLSAWLAFGMLSVAGWMMAAAIVAFLVLVVVHARVIERRDRAARAVSHYERGLDRLAGRWAGRGPDGARFLAACARAEHAYARDLDLFGEGSLFQLLSVARTESGEETLAAWLTGPAAPAEILSRQGAVRELATRLDFREDVAVLAAEAQVGRTSALTQWARAAPIGLRWPLAFGLAALVAVTIALIAAGFAGALGPTPVLIAIAAQFAVAAIWRGRAAQVVQRIDLPAYELWMLSALLARVEGETFESPRLAAQHRVLALDGRLASARVAVLRKYIGALDALHNPLFAPIGQLLLVPIFAAIGIDRWHDAHRASLAAWLDAIGEFEALGSLAGFAYEHPENPFPAIVDDGPLVEAVALAHPLITDAAAVPNDVALGGSAPRVLVVSGSNMSGKSTLLRAVGVNVVLALAGAPVRAARMRVSPLAIGATLRVEDSLQAGHSRFYTEILRIRSIVESARGQLPVLFLLDEILHGTNSHDRRIGAEAIVRSLVGLGAIGLVTTHDLALTELAVAMGARARNVHFEDRLEAGRLVFDYRMRDGVVEHSNALALMRAIGLDV